MSCLGFPQSSTSVLLNSLVKLGYLDFEVSSRTYLPSLRAAVLATWRDTGYFRDGSILTLLESLASKSALAACITLRDDIFVRYLNVVQHRKQGDFHITLTARRYAVQSAAGIVLLTALPDNEIRMLVHRTRAEDNPEVKSISFDDVMARVQKARESGHFISYGLVNRKTGAIAIQLPDEVTGGWQRMALSLAGRIEQVEANAPNVLEEMKKAISSLIHNKPY